MDERSRGLLEQQLKMLKGAAIIDGRQEEFRQDGYSNLLNKYGTEQDNSTVYHYAPERFTGDMELIHLYEGNGLFTKIIDRPAEEAVKHGLNIDFGDRGISEYVDDQLDSLGFEDKFATAEKWARLFGGSIIVMLVDDGRGLEEPLDWDNVKSIEELRVFERAIVQPDYTSMYHFHFFDSMKSARKFDEPEYYHVYSMYGYFAVHRSRCLIFRNGRLPEQTTDALYRHWGIPEYVKIKQALRECITSHENGVKLLERCVQPIYKMKNLANLLSTVDGEDNVLRRLQIIDMARSILNSIAIDADAEEYSFESFALSGVKDVLDAACNMLSAVTDIPQTILFGRSPAGMNSTGESDMENYYNMVENIQKQNMKANVRIVLDLILRQGVLNGKIMQLPNYKVKFAALWSLSETEKAGIDQTKVQTEYTKAQTMQLYMDSNVLDPLEVRKSLAKEENFIIEEDITDGQLDLSYDMLDLETDSFLSVNAMKQNADEKEALAAAVVIIHNGKILCGKRKDLKGICGPGGHIEVGETSEEAASREAQEEFGVTPLNLLPLGEAKGLSGWYLPSKLYFTDEFLGIPKADGEEMQDARWMSVQELQDEKLFPPFEESIKTLLKLLTGKDTDATIISKMDGGTGSGNFGHGGRPGQIGGSSESAGKEVDFEAAKEFTNAVKGTVAANGVVVSKVSGHAGYRMKQRGISSEDLIKDLQEPSVTYPGNKKNKNATCFQRGKDRIVLSQDGVVISTINLEDD